MSTSKIHVASKHTFVTNCIISFTVSFIVNLNRVFYVIVSTRSRLAKVLPDLLVLVDTLFVKALLANVKGVSLAEPVLEPLTTGFAKRCPKSTKTLTRVLLALDVII
jgi:hypothetical protein